MKRRTAFLMLFLAGGLAGASASPGTQLIGLSTNALTVDAPVGGPNPAPSIVTLQNSGDGTLKWTTTSNQPWLTVNPKSGKLNAAESSDLSILVNVGGLAVGTYSGT